MTAQFICKHRKFIRERDYWNSKFNRWQTATDYEKWVVLFAFNSIREALKFFKGWPKTKDDKAIFYRGKRVERCRCGHRAPLCLQCEILASEAPKQQFFDFAAHS